MKTIMVCSCVLFSLGLFAQGNKDYAESLLSFQKNYVHDHEVVKGKDKKKMRFYTVSPFYKTNAKVERIEDSIIDRMKTSGTIQKDFYRYAYLYFNLGNTPLKLTLYKSVKSPKGYEDYLFLPFTDESSGEKSYTGGRYIDFIETDILNDTLIIDFNKAYNPYCAYTTGYNCPVPPRENHLPLSILAGEMDFKK